MRGLWPLWRWGRLHWLLWLERDMNPTDMRLPEVLLERFGLERCSA